MAFRFLNCNKRSLLQIRVKFHSKIDENNIDKTCKLYYLKLLYLTQSLRISHWIPSHHRLQHCTIFVFTDRRKVWIS